MKPQPASIRKDEIDYDLAHGGERDETSSPEDGGLKAIFTNRTLLLFLACGFLFHFANAAMLPQLGEMLSHGSAVSAAPFMSACIIVTQAVIMFSAAFIGRFANQHGRKPLLLLGSGMLPLRAVCYTLTHQSVLLIGIQLLDGVANAVLAWWPCWLSTT